MIRLPVHMIETLSKIKRTTIELSTKLNRVPTKDEIAAALDMPVSKLTALMKSSQGTISIETSELLSGLLNKRHIPHDVLNAKQHEREADINSLGLIQPFHP